MNTTKHNAGSLPRPVRRWRRARPQCGGWWEWMENGSGRVEKLLLAQDGSEIAEDDEWEQATGKPAVHDGWVENYWESTKTTQKMMPGLWRQCPPNDRTDELAGAAPVPSSEIVVLKATGTTKPVKRLVRHSCNCCARDGQLVCQTVQPKPANFNPEDPRGPWVFRYYLCRWHLAAWNRSRMDGQRKMTVVEYVDDATLLANAPSAARRRRTTPLPVKPGELADRGTCPESVESGISEPWPLPVGVITERDYFPSGAGNQPGSVNRQGILYSSKPDDIYEPINASVLTLL